MRASALPLLLLLLAGCSSADPPMGDEAAAEEGRSGRASDGSLDALLVQPGSPFLWQGSTDSCTGLEMPYSCTGQSVDGSSETRIGVHDVVQTLRVTLTWTAGSDDSRVLDVFAFVGNEVLVQASGPSPIELDVADPPEALRVLVRLPEPEVARVGDGRAQAFEGRAEAV